MGYYTKRSYNLSIFNIDIMIVKTFLALTKIGQFCTRLVKYFPRGVVYFEAIGIFEDDCIT